MRVTIDLDEPILQAVKSLAAQRGRSMGKVVSELLAEALASVRPPRIRNGLPVFPRTGDAGPATPDLVNALRDGGLPHSPAPSGKAVLTPGTPRSS